MIFKGINYQLFSKSIQKHLFMGLDGRYSLKNSVVVIDNLVKYVLNPIKNISLSSLRYLQVQVNQTHTSCIRCYLGYCNCT